MCTADFANQFSSTQSATTGSGAPYAFGGSSSSADSAFSQNGATLILGGLSAGLKSFSSMRTASNAATADEAQADAARTNALIAERAAASAIATGQDQASNTEMRGAQVQAAQRAALAANGVDVNTGTAANVQASTKWQTSADVNTITANAARAAMGYTQQETNYANQAGALEAAAGRNSSAMAGFTSLLGSATDVASNWYRNQRAGVK